MTKEFFCCVVAALLGRFLFLEINVQFVSISCDFVLVSIHERLERTLRAACLCRNWPVVRLCASALHKVADSLAPSITMLLVRGKQFSILAPTCSSYRLVNIMQSRHLAMISKVSHRH